jgi:hypothetical protein
MIKLISKGSLKVQRFRHKVKNRVQSLSVALPPALHFMINCTRKNRSKSEGRLKPRFWLPDLLDLIA